MPERVARVLTADTRRDLSDLINAAAAEHGFDPVGFLAGLIGESNLHEHAARENNQLDWSYGLSQPNMPYLHPDCGLPLARGERGVVLHTPENIRLFRAWAFDAGQLLPYTARRYAELIERFQTGGDALLTWTRWNAPHRSLAENAAVQPHAVRNYRKGLAEAQQYRAAQEEPMPSNIADLRGTLPVLEWGQVYGTRSLSSIDGCVVHFTDGPATGTIQAIAEHQISAAATGQTGAGQPFPAIAYHYAIKGDGIPHRLHDLTTITWHAGNANATKFAVVFTGKGAPNAAQLDGMAACIVDAERQLGRLMPVSFHKDHSATNCPGNYEAWRQQLLDAVGRARIPSKPAPPAVDNDTLYRQIGSAAHEIAAATNEIMRLALPGSAGGDTTITDSQAVGGVVSACDIIDRHRLAIVDKAGQVTV